MDSVSKKKNSDFHTLFPTMPLSELLVSDYGCALQKGTLVQGRLYVTQNFVSFHSNLFGWVNRISIPFSEIVFIEKRHVAYVIPSAIQVNTLHRKYMFTSFRNRDSVVMQLLNLWK
ncbi:GRAM-domain-containing protein, partial [Neoconidiobolus thromboides FSU 785]